MVLFVLPVFCYVIGLPGLHHLLGRASHAGCVRLVSHIRGVRLAGRVGLAGLGCLPFLLVRHVGLVRLVVLIGCLCRLALLCRDVLALVFVGSYRS